MGITAFTLVLFPICLLWFGKPLRLLQVMVVVAIFEAAAALVVGGLGVQPGLVPALGFIFFISIQLLLGARYPGTSRAWSLLMPFILVVVWAILGSLVLPRLFEGMAYVWPLKSTPPFVITPLAPNSANLTQDVYLAINAIFLVFATLYLTSSRLKLGELINAYFLSCIVAAGIGVWQLASRVAGVPYPDSVIYSNPGWAILTGQQIGSMPRINGTFPEPSALGGYMAACVCATGWLILQGMNDRRIRLLFVIGLLTVMISTSTTGFATLAVAAAFVALLAIVTGSTRLMAGVLRVGLPMLGLVVCLFAVSAVFAPNVITTVANIFDATATKRDSSSYADRTTTDRDSIQAAIDTYGLGAGWGSNRSSSLIPGLLAGVGLPGVVGLVWFAAAITSRVRKVRRQGCTREQRLVIDACCGSLFGFVAAALISGPTISSVTFFLLLALLIATVVRAEMDYRAHQLNALQARNMSRQLEPAGAYLRTGHHQ